MHPVAHRGVRQHDRALDLGDLAPLRRPPRRLRHDRGCGRARPRGLGPCRGPRGADLRRAGRRSQHGGRAPHHRPVPGRVGRGGLHGAGAGRRRHRAGRRGPHQRARDLTPLNDLAESRAITKVFGEPGPLVTSTKGVTGHGLAAAGAIEAVAAVLTIHHATIPPTAGYEEPDPEITIAGRARGAAAVAAQCRTVELLRLRRPQRLPGPAASRLRPAGKVAPSAADAAAESHPRSVDGKAANLRAAAWRSLPVLVAVGVVVVALVAGGVVLATRSTRAPAPPAAPPVRPAPSPSVTRCPTDTGWPTPT